MTELKPCPFCGSTPRTNHPPMRSKVFCNTCGAETATVEDWNCRPDTEADTLRAEVARLTDLLLRAVDDIEKGWLAIEYVEEKYNTDGSWHVVQDIRAALAHREDDQ
jgi:hypothetical protein